MSISTTFGPKASLRVVHTPSPFEETYLRTLRHILAFQEEPASHALNSVRALLKTTDDERGSPATAAIKQELRDHPERMALMYGDYKSNDPSPWIKDRKVLAMIYRHASTLGTDEDLANCASFLKTTAATFKFPIPTPSAA